MNNNLFPVFYPYLNLDYPYLNLDSPYLNLDSSSWSGSLKNIY